MRKYNFSFKMYQYLLEFEGASNFELFSQEINFVKFVKK